MRTKTEVVLHECDAPGCTVRRIGRSHEDPPDGVSGELTVIRAGQGAIEHWWACKRGHVTSAVRSALDEAYHEMDGSPSARQDDQDEDGS